jgi:hypothetical protein
LQTLNARQNSRIRNPLFSEAALAVVLRGHGRSPLQRIA